MSGTAWLIVTAAGAVWIAASVGLGLLIGRVIQLADRQLYHFPPE